MNLLEKQKELQRSSYKLLQERIEELKKGQTGDFSKAKGMLNYVQQLIVKIDAYKQKFFYEVVSKTVQHNEAYYSKLLENDYKNMEDFLTEPLTLALLEPKKSSEAFEIFKNSKKKFQERDEKHLKERFLEVVKHCKERLKLGGDTYNLLSKEKNSIFKEVPQRVALAIWELPSNDIAYMLMTHLLSLQEKDNADAKNTANTRQSFGDEVGESFHERMAWRFLSSMVEEKEKLKELFNDYHAECFYNIEELSRPLWHNIIELEVGQKLLDLAIESEIIAEYTKPHDEGNFNYLKLHKTFLEKMNKNNQNIAHVASMVYKPMVIEPLNWQGLHGGGFLQDNLEQDSRFNLSVIKASTALDRKALRGKEIPKSVLDAVNHLQKSSFAINRKMLDVLNDYHSDINYVSKKNRVDFAFYRIMKEMLNFEKGKSKKEFYAHFKKMKFIKLTRDETLTTSDKKRIDDAYRKIEKERDREALKLQSNIYYEIAKYKQGFETIVTIAKEMSEYKKFYFVWQMDFRGRLYPKQTLLNPQAGDLAKSLLLFAEERRLTTEGKRWFFVHGANCYGEVDKQPYSERVAWIEQNSDKILASATNYRSEKFWKTAGDPFKFLAWCFEYKRYVALGDNFKTALPIAIDGSNNGFQHISVLLRDAKGAEMVNVLPHYKEGALVVADFYSIVAIELKRLMEKEYEKFEKEREDYLEKNGLFYVEEEEEKFEPSYYFNEISAFLEGVEVDSLKHGQFFSTHIDENFDALKLTKEKLNEINNALVKLERKVRKEVGEEDLEEVRDSMVDELEKFYKRAKRELKKGKIELNEKGCAISKIKVQKLVSNSFYKKLLDAGKINRSFVKGPVMTESYGSGTKAKAKAILEDLEGTNLLIDIEESQRFIVAQAITRLFEKALSSVSKSPSKYKNWMKNYAKKMANKSAVKWETPLGLEIEQVEYKSNRVKVSIGGGFGRKVSFKIFTDERDEQKHIQGFSPNYIHSLDATHLMMTINELKKEGISDIVTVHDSFATHANDVGMMSKILRESFITLHESEILEAFRSYVKKEFNFEGKEIPYVDKESFNLKKIVESEYFFC